MLEIILKLICMIVFFPLSVWFVIYPRIIDDARWYGTFSEYLYLYCFPAFFFFAGVSCGITSFEAMGMPWPDWLAYGTAVPATLLLFIGCIATLGVPMPPFLTPKWVRERRKEDREYKRQVKAERKAERRRRRAAKHAGRQAESVESR
ncbi:hypothetical protein [Nesterenkonia halobia]|uniref:Uncharacterized protein n=1 Tax=Nesterenkonia halobia TaxID=37922 RepID=A0ABP6R9Y6_9MICC